MKYLLKYAGTTLRQPGRHHKGASDINPAYKEGEKINPKLKDEVLLCYDVCNEKGEIIVMRRGADHIAFRERLEESMKDYTIHEYPAPAQVNTVQFQARRVFSMEFKVRVADQ